MKKVRVDFNRRGAHGRVVGSSKRASEPVQLGELVTVYQPGEDDMVFTARVASLDPNTGRLELDVRWEADYVEHRPEDAPWWSIGWSNRMSSTAPPLGARQVRTGTGRVATA